MTRPHQGERGSASVLVIAVIAVVLAATGVAVTLAQVAVARHRAAAAADLAALAGAASPITRDACAAAGEIAARNEAQLTSCTWDDGTVTVVVTVRSRIPGRADGVVTARARAGPAHQGPGQ